jgi:hypothetical protein
MIQIRESADQKIKGIFADLSFLIASTARGVGSVPTCIVPFRSISKAFIFDTFILLGMDTMSVC